MWWGSTAFGDRPGIHVIWPEYFILFVRDYMIHIYNLYLYQSQPTFKFSRMYRCCEYIVRLWLWHEIHKADLRDSLLRLTTPEQSAEGRFTTGHAELHLVRAMAHHAMGNDQEAPAGEWEASLHVIFKCIHFSIHIFSTHTHTHIYIYICTYITYSKWFWATKIRWL